MNPAVTTCPATSTWGGPGGRPDPTAAILPSATATSRTASSPDSGSITRPSRSTRSQSFTGTSSAKVCQRPSAVSLARPPEDGRADGGRGGGTAGGQMTSGETLPRGDAARGAQTRQVGIVVVAHGGQ